MAHRDLDHGVELKFQLQTLRERGPRVRVRIRGLAEHIYWFNTEPTYLVYRPRYILKDTTCADA